MRSVSIIRATINHFKSTNKTLEKNHGKGRGQGSVTVKTVVMLVITGQGNRYLEGRHLLGGARAIPKQSFAGHRRRAMMFLTMTLRGLSLEKGGCLKEEKHKEEP